MRNPTKNYGKIPSFLIQKQSNLINKSTINPKDHNSPLSMSPLHNSTFSTVRK